MKNLILTLFFLLVFGCAETFAQSCLSDSLFTSESNDAQASQGVFMTSSKWLPGQKLRVRFLDGDPNVIAKVRRDAETWEQFANIDFVFVESGPAEIRVSFRYPGSWSLVGKKSSIYSSDGAKGYTHANGASMNFGWLDAKTSDVEVRRVTLHEFGHALGLLHEHQNTNRTFEWNVPVVLNHFMNELGWSRDKVEEQVFDRYGKTTEYSNRRYDPLSIMHYQIPADYTLNGQTVGNNTVLSTGDKAIIQEMYPRATATANPASGVTFADIDVEHNVVVDGEKGMNITVDFTIKNGLAQQHRLAAFFYDLNGQPLKDANGKLNSTTGTVAVSKFFTPGFENARYQSSTLFMPYSELHMPCGDFKLRFGLAVQKGTATLAQSGAQYFTYGRCPTAGKLDAVIKHDVTVDGKPGMRIYPTFALRRAKGELMKLTAYFYRADGTKLMDIRDKQYAAVDGQVATWGDLKPCCETTNYNLGENFNFSLFIPYDELGLSLTQRQDLRINLVLTSENTRVVESGFKPFAIDKRLRFRLNFENACDETASVLIYFKNMADVWEAKGWYNVAPGKTMYVEDTRNRIYYYYARSKSHQWNGSRTFAFGGVNYLFREVTAPEKDWGVTKTKLTCNGN